MQHSGDKVSGTRAPLIALNQYRRHALKCLCIADENATQDVTTTHGSDLAQRDDFTNRAEQMAVDGELAAVRGLQLGDSLTHGGNRQGTQPCPYAWAIEQSSCTSQQL